eukprot:TRINITY_DN5045_c0_g2_i2.p2 TRINITY_DN5045_c0_g2~~TRINITY_DN5045_c0_g2_i2.p2  ORF type:complete len:126 (-),score=54.53 TRINITY_DN5045_c0_g2_i2:136-513(-)
MTQFASEDKLRDLNLKISKLKGIPGFMGYIVLTQDCIPIYAVNIQEEEAICYAAVIADLVQKTNTTLKLGSTDGREELKSIRMRTRKGVEIIVTVASGYTLVVLQDCTAVADVRPKDAKGDDELK